VCESAWVGVIKLSNKESLYVNNTVFAFEIIQFLHHQKLNPCPSPFSCNLAIKIGLGEEIMGKFEWNTKDYCNWWGFCTNTYTSFNLGCRKTGEKLKMYDSYGEGG
jgi:hypothetical protein